MFEKNKLLKQQHFSLNLKKFPYKDPPPKEETQGKSPRNLLQTNIDVITFTYELWTDKSNRNAFSAVGETFGDELETLLSLFFNDTSLTLDTSDASIYTDFKTARKSLIQTAKTI